MNSIIVADQDVAELKDHVGGLWPAHRLPSLKARSLLRWLGKPVLTVCVVLDDLFEEDPDAAYPVWRAVRARIYQTGGGQVIKFEPKKDGHDSVRDWWREASSRGADFGCAKELLIDNSASDASGQDCEDWFMAVDLVSGYRFYHLHDAELGHGPDWVVGTRDEPGRRELLIRAWQAVNKAHGLGPNTRRVKDAWLDGLRLEARRGNVAEIGGDPVPAVETPF